MTDAQKTILVVEDNDHILELITYHLRAAGFHVLQTFTGEEALERASIDRPDLILLDLMLPGMSGLEVCIKLKGDTATRMIPVTIVSARGADADVVAGLEAGADDYIIKPFHPPVFLDEVRDILRRVACSRPDPDRERVYGGLRIDPAAREAWLAGDRMPLSEVEFQVLDYLAQHAGRICTRAQIMAALGIDEEQATDFSVDDEVFSLGKKLGEPTPYLETIRRIGFRFKDPGA
jgi:two-component system phosphate regulon response regulator PhoB